MRKSGIYYSMCWEDPDIALSSLNIGKNDNILSICSGGEMIFSFMLKSPLMIYAVDSNIRQLFLAELKLAAIKSLSFEEFTGFIGFTESSRRVNYFYKIRDSLSERCRKFWENNLQLIKLGVIHSGKFEYYIAMFRKDILNLLVGRRKIMKYLSMKNISQQKSFFDNEWNGFLWRLFFRIFFSKAIMKILGRDKKYFRFADKNIGRHYYEKSSIGITEIPAKDNYFMHFLLSGRIPVPFKGHPYLDKNNFVKLKTSCVKIIYANDNVRNFLITNKIRFNKFYLSDIFESCPQKEYEEMLFLITKSAIRNSRICYWNNLAVRNYHSKIEGLKLNRELSQELFRKSRVFFYSDFIIEEFKG